jgi:two-component system, NarL family, response regulator LiaR
MGALQRDDVDRPPRVVIADDDPIARRAVRDALQEAGIIVIAEAGNGHDAVELSLHYQADAVLMDVVMPITDGILATRRLAQRAPEITVIMLSANDDEEVGLTCLRVGAMGFLPKTIGLSSLPRALRAAMNGEAVISRRLATRLVEGARRSSPDGLGVRPVRSALTSREWEVLDLLCGGNSTDGIAETLFLSSETVRSHVKNILRKLNVHNREEAILAARGLRGDIVGLDQAAA